MQVLALAVTRNHSPGGALSRLSTVPLMEFDELAAAEPASRSNARVSVMTEIAFMDVILLMAQIVTPYNIRPQAGA